MGVPKFYRWLSERYACLSQVIKDHQIPEFDNLYLDMNGIIHPCSHPNDDDPHFRITEEQIFKNIFHYIEVLFRIIKPQKVFFMAVDGVAPRAKMNQQRSRRFRSAKEAEDNIRRALQKGEVLPTEERFDSNCITPGTEFMVRLHEQLKYFVNQKITTDPGWQGIKIYLSGHETPGEGEHKVMDFIRYERSQPDYDHNTRHCLYGLDADLLMLGLTSHDPHFSLLREEIRFGKNAKRVSNPEEITFHLLHLSLLREYIDWEFESLKTKISFGYDVEKIIDDWILMGFLVGNDFIPNLPNLHINHDALPYLWQVYKDVMPTLDGYLHDGGFLNLSRFESYLKILSKFDLEKFEEAYVDLKWLEGKRGASNEEEEIERDEIDSSAKKLAKISLGPPKKSGKLRDYLQEKGVLEEAEEEDNGDFSNEHEKYKLQHYVEKFELKEDESGTEFVKTLCLKYVEAIQWILHYYFNGVPSWGWFFPYHYAPFVSDIKNFKDEEFPFDIGRAFLPFEQLLAVLPAASRKLLPESFRDLMIMEHSPIIDYYPLEFKTDLNGKRQEWEAVVLIPFIAEVRLVAAMEPRYSRLNNNEKKRNCHSPCLIYTFDNEKSEKYPSPIPCASFPDLECCHASSEEIPIDKYRLRPEQITKGLLPAVKLDVYFPGFPTLKHVPHTGEMKKVGVKVFQMHSRGESMVLKIDESEESDIKEVSESLLGKPCFVGWPHLVEAFVTTVSDGKVKYFMSKQAKEHVQEVKLNASEASGWKKRSSCESQFYLEKRAVDVGMVHVIVEACQIQGKKHLCDAKGDVHLEKVWSEWAVAFPLQVTVKNISMSDETDAAVACANIEDFFPVGTECFMMAVPHYGSSGKVIEVDLKLNRIRVQLTVVPELDLLSLMEKREEFADVYMPAYIMAKRLGVTAHVLAQITGKVFVAIGKKEGSSKVDIGLNLKFSKQNKEVLGYARRYGTSWSYSPKTERVISMYQEKYPEVFDVLSSSSSKERHTVSEVFPKADHSKILSEVGSWLKTLPSHNQTAVPCGSDTLDEPIVKQIEEAVEQLKADKQNKKNVKVRVKPTVLYRPMKHMGQVPPDPNVVFELFDRVVNVRTLGVAPYGLKGTIVGIHQGKTEKDEKSYEVLFDEPFMGGQSLRGSFENKLFVVHAWSLLNLTHGVRLEEEKKGRPSPHAQQRRSGGQHLQGAPADYRPSGRAGSRNVYDALGAWRAPLDMSATSPDRRHRHSPQRPGPEYRFPSPRHNSPFSQQPQQHLPRKQVPGFRPRLLLNPQRTPHGNSHQQSVSSKASDTVEPTLSAQESERMIKDLLKMNGPDNDTTPYPQMKFNNTDHNPLMPPMSPISPSAVSVPSGILDMICRQNRWPPPSFSHYSTPQGYVATLCVAGKMYQGLPSTSIVESTEGAARIALSLNGLWPQAFPFPSPMIYNPNHHSLPRPGFPYAPPGHSLRPPMIRHQGHAQFGPPNRNYNGERKADRENWRQTPTTPVSADTDKSSESPRNSPSSIEVKTEPKSNLSGGQRKDIFIPHQVSLKNKDVSLKNKDVSLKDKDVPVKDVPVKDKDVPIASQSNVQVETKLSAKTSEPERNEASPKPSENGPPKRNHNVERKADQENWQQTPTTPVSADTEKSSESPRNSSSSIEVKTEPKSNLSGGQPKDTTCIPLQVSLKNKDVPVKDKDVPVKDKDVPIASQSNVQVETKLSAKTSEPERNEASPKPSENGPPKRNHNVERKADQENWQQTPTTPVSADTEKSSESPRNSSSSIEVKTEPKSNLSGGQPKDTTCIPLQVSLKNKDVPVKDKDVPIASQSNVQVETKLSAKTSEPERNEASPKPSENETSPKPTENEASPKPSENEASPKPSENEATPKEAKGEPGKAKQKLLAPSFFQKPRPSN